jgi:hypothetical protein
MTQKEKELFHLNYEYMWNKLNTTHYYVKCYSNTDRSLRVQNIEGREILPSYTICSKCMNKEYEPSMAIVRKIVNFFNLNISPQISTIQFLRENLSLTDNSRYLNRTLFDQRFLGTFYGYYPSASTASINGAMLKIYTEDDLLRAILVTGIRSDDELYGNDLANLFSHELVQKHDFDQYYKTRTVKNQRCYFYEGLVELTNCSLLITFRGVDPDQRKLIMTLNVECFPAGLNRSYSGGLSFVLTSNDGPFDVRFFKMGIINSLLTHISLKDNRLQNILKITDTGKEINLTSTVDRVWYEFILDNVEKHQ